MSLFGKILVVFNLLAAGGFVYLATQDWKGRQNINAAGAALSACSSGVCRSTDRRTSVPSDDTPFRIEGPGGVPTTTVSKKLLESLLPGRAGR